MTHPVLGTLGAWLLRRLAPDHLFVMSKEWDEWGKSRSIATSFVVIAGVDVERFHPISDDEKLQIRRELRLPPDEFILLHVGHMRKNRNLLALITCQRMPGIQVVVLASSALRVDGQLRSALEDAGCIVHMGYVPHVEQYYQAADCYLFPTLVPSGAIEIPLSILEAMSTNLPVVSTDFGGLRDLFPPGNGLVYVSREDMVDLPGYVRSALQNVPVSNRLLVKDYSWENVAARLVNHYLALMEGR